MVSLDCEEFQIGLEHIEKLLDRRQVTTSFYLSVNTGISAVIGALLKGARLRVDWLSIAVLLLLCAGLTACFIWRALLRQYEIWLEWWYARLRELEASIPGSARLVTREYEDLYVAAKGLKLTKRIGMTKRKLAPNLVFTGLYAAFTIGVLWNWSL